MTNLGGRYEVKENGIHFVHEPEMPVPQDSREYLERFASNFDLKILEAPSDDELVFEMIGIDASFANALRRIMIAEVPSVAIEHVYMLNNSSIVHDEVLSHRIGLVPINADSRLFDDFLGVDDEPTDRNTVVFRLTARCRASNIEGMKKGRTKQIVADDANKEEEESLIDDTILDHDELDQSAEEAMQLHQSSNGDLKKIAEAIEIPGRPYTLHVYSKDLEWVPQGDQGVRFQNGIRPVHGDILLAKLRPGQVIELEAHGRRGIGKDHAKFSPVATASYRLMPHIEFFKPVYDKHAEILTNLYEPGVFSLKDCDPDEAPHKVKAILRNPYACTMSRNFMRDPILKESIRMTRISNHFIFSVESVGMMKPGVILAEALRILQSKGSHLIRLIDEAMDADHLID